MGTARPVRRILTVPVLLRFNSKPTRFGAILVGNALVLTGQIDGATNQTGHGGILKVATLEVGTFQGGP